MQLGDRTSKQHWLATSDESTGDKQATAVTKVWQNSTVSAEVECEVPIEDNLNEKIDVIDFSTATAYEMKVSGKNPQHEFYKDIFKVLIGMHPVRVGQRYKV